MAQEDQKEIEALLARFPVLITYLPLRTEVDFRTVIRTPNASTYEVKPRASLDPIQEAARAKALAEERPAAVLLPGRWFDSRGTRHGQGGGWYDRFLAEAPSSWLRVGFCFDQQFSHEPLAKNPWDQSVDVVCVVAPAGGALSIYETKARPEFSGTLLV